MDPVAPPPVRPSDPLGWVLGRYLLTGDEGAIEEVVAATRARLLAAARRIAGPDDAEDAVQTAYLSLVRRRGAPLDAPVLPWLLTAVVRNAYRRRAASRRDASLADRLAMVPDDAVVEDLVAADPDVVRLRAAVHRLPARYRDVVVLHDLHGLSTAETARLLDLSEAGVRTRLHRARALVRARLVPRFVAAALALPWFVVDRVRDAGGLSLLGLGGLMNVTAAAATAAVALALGIFVGRSVLAPTDPSGGERVETAELRARELEVRAAQLERERDGLREDLARRTAALAPRPAAEPAAGPQIAPPASPPPDAAMAAPAPANASGTVAVAGFEALVAEIDWKAVGKSLAEMTPLMPAFMDEWAKTQKLPAKSFGRINQANAGLVQAAITAAGHLKYDLMSANSAYTHPSFLVNAMAAALEAAGKPLTPAQLDAVTLVAAQSAAEETRRRAGYDESAWELQKLLDESALKQRMVDACFAQLSAEQREILAPESVRGRMQADVLSPALIWLRSAQMLPFADRDDLARKATAATLDLLGMGEDKGGVVGAAVSDTLAGFPPEVLDQPADAASMLGMLPLARVVDAATRELAMLKRLAETLRLEGDAAKGIRTATRVLVPAKGTPTLPR